MSISAAMVALMLAVPAAVLFGIKREPIYGTLCGFDCSVDEQYKKLNISESVLYYPRFSASHDIHTFIYIVLFDMACY